VIREVILFLSIGASLGSAQIRDCTRVPSVARAVNHNQTAGVQR